MKANPIEVAEAIIEAFEAGDRLPGLSARETLMSRIATIASGGTIHLPVSVATKDAPPSK